MSEKDNEFEEKELDSEDENDEIENIAYQNDNGIYILPITALED